MNEKVNNVSLGRLDDLNLQKPFYLFLLLPISLASPVNNSAYVGVGKYVYEQELRKLKAFNRARTATACSCP